VPQDFSLALKSFNEAAVKGSVTAIHNLGLMYSRGLGVQQDEVEGFRRLKIAADYGFPASQFIVGWTYAHGKSSIPQDFVRAHMWFNLSAAAGNTDAVKARDDLAKKMSASQIAEAQQLARQWKPTPATNPKPD
jgi:uncharacterized protein